MKPGRVRITKNFARNLDKIGEFLREADAEEAFADLLDDLFDRVIPALGEFPDLGADFFRHETTSHEALLAADKLRRRLGGAATLRELIRGDYLLLYARRDHDLFLLAIRHHRQLSFDLTGQWSD